MKIIRIFEDIPEDESLIWEFIFQADGIAEYDRLMEQWFDPEYLEHFFEDNKTFLDTDFWQHMSVEDAIIKTLDEASNLDEMIYELACGQEWGEKKSLYDVFVPLYKQDAEGRHKDEFKAKPDSHPPFLRLYGLRLADGTIIVASGGIKLVGKMDESTELEEAKKKIGRVKHYCKENGINYLEDLITE